MKVYLDYAATTPIDPRVLAAMLPYFKEKFGNPSSLHSWGQEARAAVEDARERVAKALGCSPREIYFTGTTTTSDNLAIQGVARAAKKRGRNQLITSAVEHHAVLDTCQALKKEGFELTVLPVDRFGVVDLAELERVVSPKTALVSIMYANNEVGTIQPIKKIAAALRKAKVPQGKQAHLHTDFHFQTLHTDAAAVVDYLDLKVKNLGVDLMTIGGHKFGGPKGVGALYLRDGVEIEPITFGGHHERQLWPGTEAVPLIIGLAKALEIAVQGKSEAVKKVTCLRDKLIKGVLSRVPGSQLTGHPVKRLPDIASFIFDGVEGEAMLLKLDEKGIAASSGSACTSGELKPSHVLTAMGISPELAHGSIRFSLGKSTTERAIDYVIKVLPGIVGQLRKMAPRLGTRH